MNELKVKVAMKSKTCGDVIGDNGKVIGHVEQDSSNSEWKGFMRGKVGFDHKSCFTVEEAAEIVLRRYIMSSAYDDAD